MDEPTFRIVIVVCHPDDEALWVGGLVCALVQFSRVEVDVICLSGRDKDSHRELEFERAREVAGYCKGVVLGFPLRTAPTALPRTGDTLEEGLNAIALRRNEISVLITHSPYGDEHMHPHHQQAHRELARWAATNDVPFGFFSSIPLPDIELRPLLGNLRRMGAFQVLNFASCRPSLVARMMTLLGRGNGLAPRYYLQFLVDAHKKQKMLNCYESVDIDAHRQGYAMFTSNCESIYLNDARGLKPFEWVMSQMDVPGAADLFAGLDVRRRLKNAIRRRLGRAA